MGITAPDLLKGKLQLETSKFTQPQTELGSIWSLPFTANLSFSGATTVIFFTDEKVCDLYSPIGTPVTRHPAPLSLGHTLSIF